MKEIRIFVYATKCSNTIYVLFCFFNENSTPSAMMFVVVIDLKSHLQIVCRGTVQTVLVNPLACLIVFAFDAEASTETKRGGRGDDIKGLLLAFILYVKGSGTTGQ